MASECDYMKLCLQLAAEGRYTTMPNPMVGCVIVKDERIVGQGVHLAPGSAHAEIQALRQAGNEAQGATLYVNLEPCCHYGRTPPCVPEIIKAGIKKVVFAMEDPNPEVLGRGSQALQQHSLKVVQGVLKEEAFALNRAFCHYMTHSTPYVLAKWAMSLDGQMETSNASERQLTGGEAQQDVHELRQSTQAIMIGSHTAQLDDPALTVRHCAQILRQPQRIVVNKAADLNPALKLFNGTLPGKTWLACAETVYTQAKTRFNPDSTELLPAPVNAAGLIDLEALLKLLGQRAIMSLLVEGGRTLLNSFFQAKAVQEIITYICPTLMSNLPQKQALASFHFELLGPDVKIRTTPKN